MLINAIMMYINCIVELKKSSYNKNISNGLYKTSFLKKSDICLNPCNLGLYAANQVEMNRDMASI